MQWVTCRGDSERTGVLAGYVIYVMSPDVTLLYLVASGVDWLRAAGEDMQRSPLGGSTTRRRAVDGPDLAPTVDSVTRCVLYHMCNCQAELGF